MKVVYKYQIPSSFGIHEVTLPIGADILRFGVQNNDLFIWAKVDTEQRAVRRQFLLIGTGIPFEEEREIRHIESLQEGALVFHLFEVGFPQLVPASA